jgi:hypothetical protein
MADWSCRSCGAHWSGGAFTAECRECGGGAMTRACLLCGGRCGAAWTRAPLDSWDFSEAHWVGGCALPPDEKLAVMRDLTEDGPR